MARNFIQMGMTRAKRYANYRGLRKYVDDKENGRQVERSTGHKGGEEKACLVFKEVMEKCKAHERYQKFKREFLREQRNGKDKGGKRNLCSRSRTMEGNGEWWLKILVFSSELQANSAI